MKTVILAGGLGTRISEESHLKPKPMIGIGEQPILWHILKIYSAYGFNDFIICIGYKGYVIKEYFADYYLHTSDVTFDMLHNTMEVHSNHADPWKVTVVETGLKTMTGGRLRRVREYLGDEPFMVTYGDGVSDINIRELVTFHQSHGKAATITAVKPSGRFGMLEIEEESTISRIAEKEQEDAGWINGGFMVISPKIFDLLDGDDTILERTPLETLSASGELKAFKHHGFWQCMDTQREHLYLEDLWARGHAPWKVW